MADDPNPILNNPYTEPTLHYFTDPDGQLNYSQRVAGRRVFNPKMMAMPTRRRDGQTSLLEVNDFHVEYATTLVNLLRVEVGKWRADEYPHVTAITKELLTFWFLNSDRLVTKQLFFAQREAVETAIWLNEVAARSNFGTNLLEQIQQKNLEASDATNILPRIAFKMATGTGKTVVMATLIIYHYLNRQNYRNDDRFTDNFLLVAPGVTIRDRLSVLFVDTQTTNRNNATDYYGQRGLVPAKFQSALGGLNARIVITNFHAFEPRSLQGNKKSPTDGKVGADGKKRDNKEQIATTLKRMVGKFKAGSRILVINDEAHHCYLPKGKGVKNDDENSVEENERAAVWYRGLVELSRRYKVKTVYDLSATPYFLNGSGHESGALFGWIVTDFGLTEAIEAGLVKIPFLPFDDNTQEHDLPVLRDLYHHIKGDLPKRRKTADEKAKGEQRPKLPQKLELALDQFFDHYKKEFDRVQQRVDDTPPVFIVVCNNTNVSKEVFKYLAGYELQISPDEPSQIVSGKFDLFSNFNRHTGAALIKPPTLLIDSDALENGNQIDESFKRVFAPEIDRFKQEYRALHPDKSVENLTDADLLREVVNTVGKPSTLGGHIRCVVSVSMLTEGWDANTVTHIVGIRAFGSQLLCEQVAGRALRRKSYTLQAYTLDGEPIDAANVKRFKPENIIHKFPPEYAHIIGIPFRQFKAGKTQGVIDQKPPKHVRALAERSQLEIQFPNVVGYRVEPGREQISVNLDDVDDFVVDGSDIPFKTQMATAFNTTQEELRVNVEEFREQQVFYIITKELIKQRYSDDNNHSYFDKFNQLKKIVEVWYDEKVKLIGMGADNDEYKKAVLFDLANAVEHIALAILSSQQNSDSILPVFNHYQKFGSTSGVNGFTTREGLCCMAL